MWWVHDSVMSMMPCINVMSELSTTAINDGDIDDGLDNCDVRSVHDVFADCYPFCLWCSWCPWWPWWLTTSFFYDLTLSEVRKPIIPHFNPPPPPQLLIFIRYLSCLFFGPTTLFQWLLVLLHVLLVNTGPMTRRWSCGTYAASSATLTWQTGSSAGSTRRTAASHLTTRWSSQVAVRPD